MSRVNLANDRRTFWPRAGPAAAFVPDLGDDRPCENCGYNLRGLPFHCACPECGSTWGIHADAEPIPWNEQPSTANFFRTVIMVLTGARDLAAQIWTRDMLWMKPARRFRGINIALATIALAPVILAIQSAFIGIERAIFCLPVNILCVLWWHITLTAYPARFLSDKGSPTPSKRAVVLSSYLSAALILSLLHLVLLAVPIQVTGSDRGAFMIALHGPLVALQVLMIAAAEATMLWQLVEIPRGFAFAFTLLLAIYRCCIAALYLAAIPALFANMAITLAR